MKRVHSLGNADFDLAKVTYVSALAVSTNPHDFTQHAISCEVAIDGLEKPVHVHLGFVRTKGLLDPIQEVPEYQALEEERNEFVTIWGSP